MSFYNIRYQSINKIPFTIIYTSSNHYFQEINVWSQHKIYINSYLVHVHIICKSIYKPFSSKIKNIFIWLLLLLLLFIFYILFLFLLYIFWQIQLLCKAQLFFYLNLFVSKKHFKLQMTYVNILRTYLTYYLCWNYEL